MIILKVNETFIQMDEDKKNKIVNVAYTAGEIGANFAGLWFPGIPIVAAVISGVKEWVDQKHLNDRLSHIEKSITVIEEKIYNNSTDQAAALISARISDFDQHDYYSFKRNLKFLIADAQPEVVDTYVSVLLHFLHDENATHSMDEEVMDILLQFNAHDVDLMERVEQYRNYRYQIEDADENKDGKEDKEDNNTFTVIMGFKWDEFAEFLGYKDKKLSDALTGGAYKLENGEYSYEFSYLGRSLLKLQSLGVFDLYFKMYLGSSSVTDVEFITITQFGNEILKHIAYANGWPQRSNPDAILVSH
jgi:uncharacterized protein YutE (UPF0331/DUF86 family)